MRSFSAGTLKLPLLMKSEQSVNQWEQGGTEKAHRHE